MKHALLAAMAVAALAFPGLAATATTKTHASSASHPTRATTKGKPVHQKMARPVHQMLGAVAPFIRTGPGVGQGHVLKGRSPRPQSEIPRPVTNTGLPNADDNLTWNGPDQIPPKALASLPRVMTYNVNYNIYWVPDGYRQSSNYQSVIDQYFNDVAQESGGSNNVDSPAVQYYGSSNDGPIFYDSTFGGSAVDTNPYPKAGCMKSMNAINAAADAGDPNHIHTIGETTCLSDAQIEAEVKKFADSQGWPHGPNTEFFVYTAHNVGSCFNADGKTKGGDANNVCAYDYYCAYHSEFGTSTKTEYIYANMPWPNQAYEYPAISGNNDPYKKSDCDGGEHPNGTGSLANGTDPQGATDADAADEVIGVTSHEHNESVTDPTGYGWWDDSYDSDGNPTAYNGYENGDLCAWNWSNAPLGDVTDNNSFFTNELNGDYYFTQGEWSNADANSTGWSGCVWSHDINTPTPTGDAVMSTSGGTPPVPGDTLTMTGGDYPAGTAIEFEWLRCKPDVSMASIKAAAVKHTANRFDTDPCTVVGDDFTADNTAPADTYKVTNKDVHMDVIALLLGWNGTEPDFQVDDMMIGGEPINAGGDGAPSISLPEGVESPMVGTKLTANVGTWSGNPTSFTGAWQRCTGMSLDSCKTFKSVSIRPSAPTTTYTLVAADAKYGINFLVTAKNALGTSDPAASGITDAVGGVPTPDMITGPAWSDEPAVGTPDTLDFGTWHTPDGAPVTAYSGTIRRCAVVNILGMEVVDLSNCEGNTPFSGTPTKHTVSYTPVQADDQYFLVAFVTAKNKNGTSSATPINAGIVGGHPTLTDDATVTSDNSPAAPGDTMTINMGTWTGSPSGYRVVIYACFDPSDTTQCAELGAARVYSPDTSYDYAAPDLSAYGITDYYLRADIMAINNAGFSDDVWTAAGGGEVVSPS
jgi:hypothetical protein